MELLQRQMTETLSQLRQIATILPSLSPTIHPGPPMADAVFSDLRGPSSSSHGVDTTYHGTGDSSGSGQSSSADKGKGKARTVPDNE